MNVVSSSVVHDEKKTKEGSEGMQYVHTFNYISCFLVL